MNKKPSTEKEVHALLEAIGALAEIALNFYRALIAVGADNSEAYLITRAYLASFSTPTNNTTNNLTTEGDN